MAGYVKVDEGILDSTLWANRDQRDVFLTALIMARPLDITEPTPQLEVDSLEPTGFIVPPGWYGFVAAAGPGILRKAVVKSKSGMNALRILGSPDPESRSPDYEGRRLVRVAGGYIVLNYIKYRDRDYTAAERSQRYRDKKKAGDALELPSRRDAVTPHRNVTQAAAEASAVHHPPSVSGVAAGGPASAQPLALPMAKGLWTPAQELLLRWQGAFPGVDVPGELGRIRVYLLEHPKVRFGEARLMPWVEEWLAKEAKGKAGGRSRAAPRGGPARDAAAPQARPQAAALKTPKLERLNPGGTP